MYLMLVWRKLNGTQFEIKPVQTKSKVFNAVAYNAEHYGPHIRRIHIACLFVTGILWRLACCTPSTIMFSVHNARHRYISNEQQTTRNVIQPKIKSSGTIKNKHQMNCNFNIIILFLLLCLAIVIMKDASYWHLRSV